MKNMIEISDQQRNEMMESNKTPNKGNKLKIANCFRLLDPKQKKEKYELLKIGELSDVILSRGENGFAQSNLPKRFRTSYGFNWGYSGTGPTDLALSLMLHFSNQDLDFTHKYYHDFVDDFVKYLPMDKDIVISGDMILEQVNYYRNNKNSFAPSHRPDPCDPDYFYDDNNYATLRPEKLIVDDESKNKKTERKYVR